MLAVFLTKVFQLVLFLAFLFLKLLFWTMFKIVGVSYATKSCFRPISSDWDCLFLDILSTYSWSLHSFRNMACFHVLGVMCPFCCANVCQNAPSPIFCIFRSVRYSKWKNTCFGVWRRVARDLQCVSGGTAPSRRSHRGSGGSVGDFCCFSKKITHF